MEEVEGTEKAVTIDELTAPASEDQDTEEKSNPDTDTDTKDDVEDVVDDKEKDPDDSEDADVEEDTEESEESEESDVVKKLRKQNSDKDRFIQKLYDENRKAKKGGDEQAKSYSELYADDNKEVARLYDEGKFIEGGILQNEIAQRVINDNASMDNEEYNSILTDTVARLKLPEFGKYQKEVAAAIKNIPLSALSKNPEGWIKQHYEAAVGREFIKTSQKVKSGKKVKKPAGIAGGKGKVGDGKGKAQKSASDEVLDGIATAGIEKSVFS